MGIEHTSVTFTVAWLSPPAFGLSIYSIIFTYTYFWMTVVSQHKHMTVNALGCGLCVVPLSLEEMRCLIFSFFCSNVETKSAQLISVTQSLQISAEGRKLRVLIVSVL